MNRVQIADSVEAMQKNGAGLEFLLLALTLQNAGPSGAWEVGLREGYQRALGKASPADIAEAVEHLKAAGVFADYATTWRPALAMPERVLAAAAQEPDSAQRRQIGGHLPSLDSETVAA
ncbi:hypothetical protein I8D64_01745 [Brachybacterium sp. MASK1Z-5]|uniref:Transcriptional regulator n=1 Tax=Brachybacterium halotolerans TaxID=2795215 RepID=A0ABS1B678_9MICO|nr:hypothetical protein [Brachybacterium halotolerans]MBK0330126.1 hypothetical protein [Brachybacterium halotolerans]